MSFNPDTAELTRLTADFLSFWFSLPYTCLPATANALPLTPLASSDAPSLTLTLSMSSCSLLAFFNLALSSTVTNFLASASASSALCSSSLTSFGTIPNCALAASALSYGLSLNLPVSYCLVTDLPRFSWAFNLACIPLLVNPDIAS